MQIGEREYDDFGGECWRCNVCRHSRPRARFSDRVDMVRVSAFGCCAVFNVYVVLHLTKVNILELVSRNTIIVSSLLRKLTPTNDEGSVVNDRR